MKRSDSVVPVERIEKTIFVIRGQKVILDADLAELYGVKTKILKQAVRRNIKRFPSDFMFEPKQRAFSALRLESHPFGAVPFFPAACCSEAEIPLSGLRGSERVKTDKKSS
ncbi:MAG: DNA-binding protein [Deltaproteobacteria bacterium HGW-Deltaproteobacteria-15]|jgi:hypothetical protein|nr:MAG: DNA-binding protein [Deltaproteobacteria bacterium HGW-Deltaproteobacteria-15]